jgi:hypothetical protein
VTRHVSKQLKNSGWTPSTQGHMPFGKSAHFCLGALLARLEAMTVRPMAFDRYVVGLVEQCHGSFSLSVGCRTELGQVARNSIRRRLIFGVRYATSDAPSGIIFFAGDLLRPPTMVMLPTLRGDSPTCLVQRVVEAALVLSRPTIASVSNAGSSGYGIATSACDHLASQLSTGLPMSTVSGGQWSSSSLSCLAIPIPPAGVASPSRIATSIPPQSMRRNNIPIVAISR